MKRILCALLPLLCGCAALEEASLQVEPSEYEKSVLRTVMLTVETVENEPAARWTVEETLRAAEELSAPRQEILDWKKPQDQERWRKETILFLRFARNGNPETLVPMLEAIELWQDWRQSLLAEEMPPRIDSRLAGLLAQEKDWPRIAALAAKTFRYEHTALVVAALMIERGVPWANEATVREAFHVPAVGQNAYAEYEQICDALLRAPTRTDECAHFLLNANPRLATDEAFQRHFARRRAAEGAPSPVYLAILRFAAVRQPIDAR